MTTANANRFKRRAANHKLKRPQTAKQKLFKIAKKILCITVLLAIGVVGGVTVGTNVERGNEMVEYGGEAFDSGQLEIEKLWWESVVKQASSDPINLNLVVIPPTGVVARSEAAGSLYCVSTTDKLYLSGYYYDSEKCSRVTSRIDNFNVSELERIIPEGGAIVNNGNGSYDCNATQTFFYDKTLKECLTILQTEMTKQYNDFIYENYEEGSERDELYIEGTE